MTGVPVRKVLVNSLNSKTRPLTDQSKVYGTQSLYKSLVSYFIFHSKETHFIVCTRFHLKKRNIRLSDVLCTCFNKTLLEVSILWIPILQIHLEPIYIGGNGPRLPCNFYDVPGIDDADTISKNEIQKVIKGERKIDFKVIILLFY